MCCDPGLERLLAEKKTPSLVAAIPRCHARGPFGPGEPPGSSGLDPGEGSGGEPAGSRPATGEPGTSVCFPGPGCVLNTRLKPENGSRQPSEFHCWLDTAQWQSRSENECTTPQ